MSHLGYFLWHILIFHGMLHTAECRLHCKFTLKVTGSYDQQLGSFEITAITAITACKHIAEAATYPLKTTYG